MKREVAVGFDTYIEHKDLLKQVFNEAGLWVVPTNVEDLPKAKTQMTAVFNCDEITQFGLKGTKGWVSKLIPKVNSRTVVFPELVIGGNIDWDAFKRSLQLLVAVDTSNIDVRVIRTESDRKRAIAWLVKQDEITVDFETKNTEPHNAGSKLLSVAFGNEKLAYVMALEHKDSPWLGNIKAQDEVLYFIHECKDFIAHNAKFELRWFFSRGFPFRDVTFDTMLVHSLLDENSYHGLDTLSMLYTKYGGYYLDFEGKLKSKKDYESAPIEDLLRYNALDVVITKLVAIELRRELGLIPTLLNYWNRLTRPFIGMVSSMEEQGFVVDKKELLRLFDWYDNKVRETEKVIKAHKFCKAFFANRPDFNFGSYPQMRAFLYDFLGFKVRRRTIPGDNPSTDEDAINLMRLDGKHGDVLDLIAIRVKAYTMIKSFLNVYAKRIEESADGMIRTSYNIHVVDTGRLSSTKPNMQSMPTSSALLDLGMQPIKSVFISRFKNGVMLSADESQMELRISGVYSGDPTLVDAFKEGRDLHSELAAKIYGPDFTKAERTKAKRTNFSAVFDIGAKSLAQELGIEEKEAKMMLRQFQDMHSVLYDYFNNLWDETQMSGYVENLNGRRRHIAKELADCMGDFGKKDHIRRSVWNFPIQSSAVEIALYSTLLVFNEMQRLGMKSVIMGQVHDSVIIDCHPSEVKKIVKIVKDKFMTINKVWKWINVPIVTDVSIGPNLYKLEKV